VIGLFIGFLLPVSLASQVGAHAGMDPEIHEITEQLEMEPDRVDLWIQRGQVYRSYRRYNESLQDLERAGELEPDNKKVVLERGLTLSAMGRHKEAEAALDLFLQEDPGPKRVFALAERGHIRERTGRKEQAIEDYTSVLRIQPSGELYLKRGKLQESLGRLEEAASGYEEGLARLGDSMLLKKGLIEIRIAQGKFDEALVLIDEQLTRFPSNTQWYLQRAQVLSQMGQNEEAGKTYDQALTQANRMLGKRQTAIHLLARAKILNAMGKREDAVRDLREALQKSPQFDEAEKLLQEWNGK
jgi:tetratricopeptide (TPR) repeat protein